MKSSTLFFFFCILTVTKAQNLVPNGSFETYTQCPNSGGQLDYAFPWYNPNTSSPDYFNTCGNVGFQVPTNIWGYQNPRTGNAYAELGVYGSISGFSAREYIAVQLQDSLLPSKLYCVQFYVSNTGISTIMPNAYMPIMISEIGLYFSKTPVSVSNYYPLPYTPQIASPPGVILSDTVNWMEVSGMYTAVGGEKYITIGNFKTDAMTDTAILYNNGQDPQGYYYIDDVSVTLCDTGSSVNELNNEKLFRLYPNPGNGDITLRYSVNPGEKAVLCIYEMSGKNVGTFNLNSAEKSMQLHLANLQSGVYYYSISINSKIVQTDKLVIIR